MYRYEITDSRVATSGGYNTAYFGNYRIRHQDGGDRSAGSGQSEMHSYYARHHSRTYGYFRWEQKGASYYYGWSNMNPTVGATGWDSNDELALLSKLKEQYQQHSFNGANFLGELHQTVNLLGNKLELLHRVLAHIAGGTKPRYQRYRKGKRVPPRPRPPPRGGSPIANSWLEFSFGVMPLLNDVYELAEIASKQNEIRKRIVARRKGRPGEITSPWEYASATGSVDFSKQIIAYLNQAELPTFWDQFGLSDPVTVAWELLPWSFVVDWVMPIGKFVEAQSFARRMKGTFVITERTRTRWLMTVDKDTEYYYNVSMLPDACNSVEINRTVTNVLPVPLPSLKSSLFGGKPLWRVANALSLLAQVFR